MNVKESEFKNLLLKYKKLTVIGLSPKPDRPSHRIPLYMKTHGYDIVGVNPGHDEISGIKIYKSLQEVPADYRKFLDVFRPPEVIPALVDEILAVGGVEVLWLQLGITNAAAEKKAEDNGIKVVSNHCWYIEHKKYISHSS